MARKLLFPFLLLAFFGAVFSSVFLYHEAVSRLRMEKALRLAPTFLRYRDANARLEVPQSDVLRVVLFGDSRIEEWSGLPASGPYEFVNRGIGNETTAQMLGRLENDIIALRPEVVVLQLGVNDLKSIGILRQSGHSGKIGQQTQERIKEIATRLRDAGITTVISTIFPVAEISWRRRLFWSSETEAWIARINRWLLEGGLGAGIHVWDCDAFFTRDGRMDRAFARDTLHLNPAGYQELSSRLLPVIDEVLQAGRSESGERREE